MQAIFLSHREAVVVDTQTGMTYFDINMPNIVQNFSPCLIPNLIFPCKGISLAATLVVCFWISEVCASS